MTNIHKIMCCCISGLGSSFIVEINVKKALKELDREDIEVVHAGVNDVYKGAADLFVCSADVYEICEKAGATISLNTLTDYEEVKSKLADFFETHS